MNPSVIWTIYADDAGILSEQLTVLLFRLEILSLEAPRLGLEVNWMKTMIQSYDDVTSHPPSFMIGTHEVDLVTGFTYLRVTISSELGRSSSEIRRRIEISRSLLESAWGPSVENTRFPGHQDQTSPGAGPFSLVVRSWDLRHLSDRAASLWRLLYVVPMYNNVHRVDGHWAESLTSRSVGGRACNRLALWCASGAWGISGTYLANVRTATPSW